MSTRLVGLLSLVSGLLGNGCLQPSDLHAAHADHDETTRIYDVGASQALSLSEDVLRSEGAVRINTDRSRSVSEASFDANLVAWGTEAAVWVEPLGPNMSRVSVTTKRRVPISAATRLTESGFHERFAERLAHGPSSRLVAGR